MFLPWFPQLLIGGNITHFIYTYTYQGGLFWGTPPKMLDVKAFCKLQSTIQIQGTTVNDTYSLMIPVLM